MIFNVGANGEVARSCWFPTKSDYRTRRAEQPLLVHIDRIDIDSQADRLGQVRSQVI